MAKDFNGVLENQEIKAGDLWKDTRKPMQKFKDSMGVPQNFLMVMGFILICFIAYPPMGELYVLLALWLLYIGNLNEFRLPFRIPETASILDPGQPHPGTGKPTKSAGIGFFGNEINNKQEIWFNNSDMRTHILVFGSTGAGKTEALLSIGYNALVQGSGLIYVDGKGDSSLFTKVFSMARSMGREDDILLVNYMTGAKDVFGPQETKLSNTMNPFSSGSTGGLTELMVSLMDGGGGGGDMWKGRAISLMSAIMMVLVFMRDRKEILLDVEQIRENLILDNIIKLFRRRDFPADIRTALRSYLVSLPGFQENAPKQNDTVLEQHGYLQMQFTKLLGSLSDTYGFIFKTNLAEVDFKDVVLNRRILVVLLPALEKSPDELANLGKIVIASLKQMMASALGATVEGTHREVIDTKPTTAPMPFLTILDEYGYYAVPGSAVMPAQARSLGFCMVFAGQDLPAFQKASKEEAASIIANCNIKICMKLEDPKDTLELFMAAAGEANVSSGNGFEMKDGKFIPTRNAQVERRKRIDVKDLKEQGEGEGHVFFKSSIVRIKFFFADPKAIERYRMNYFIRVEPPNPKEIIELDNGMKLLTNGLTNANKIRELEEGLIFENNHVEKMKELMEQHSSHKPRDAAFATIASLGGDIADLLSEKIKISKNLNDDDDDYSHDDDKKVNIFSTPPKRVEDDTDGSDDLDMFLNEEETLNNFHRAERLVGASSDDADNIASRGVDDLTEISSYPKGGMPEAKEAEEITDILNELETLFNIEDEEDND